MTTATPDTTPTLEPVKLVWTAVMHVGNEPVLNHLCYRTSPAIEFKPFAVDPDDQRPHALVPAAFAMHLLEHAVDPRTGESVYALADDVAPHTPAARTPRRIGGGRQ